MRAASEVRSLEGSSVFDTGFGGVAVGTATATGTGAGAGALWREHANSIKTSANRLDGRMACLLSSDEGALVRPDRREQRDGAGSREQQRAVRERAAKH